MEKLLTDDNVQSENHCNTYTINSNLVLKQESKEERIKNHITPIKTCIDLTLAGNMGEISTTQKKNFELMRSELGRITDLLLPSQDKTIANPTKYELRPQEQKMEKSKNDLPTTHTEIINIHKSFAEKNHQMLTLMILTGLIILVGINFIPVESLLENYNDQIPLTSKYVIENLKGDTVGTHKYWKTIPNKPLYVNIINSANLSEEKLQIVKDVILSTEYHEIDDNLLGKAPKGTISKYYLGWKGALSSIEQETKNDIPTDFEIISSSNGAGDIIITLTKAIDTDGTAGTTKSTTHGDQILKSEITIYDVDSLSNRSLEKTTRHEFGHAMGLAHSTAPEDLMYPQIKTPYPFISDCNISAIAALYDGKVDEEVICEK